MASHTRWALKELDRTLRIELQTNLVVAPLPGHLKTFYTVSQLCSGDRIDSQVTGECCEATSCMISNQATSCVVA
ncbi:unnamed protein product [Linum trigynum]|uniref:Uncharacterized protein n=1 Tax=Linum trigynum TaxID=586398 RepID=A0AAV2GDU7_9ROSI